MDISIPIHKLNEALADLVALDFSEAELLAECENAIDNVIENGALDNAVRAADRLTAADLITAANNTRKLNA